MSNENQDSQYSEIDISELLQIALSLQAEVGVLSDIILEVLRAGELDRNELLRSLHMINEMSTEALNMISDEDTDNQININSEMPNDVN